MILLASSINVIAVDTPAPFGWDNLWKPVSQQAYSSITGGFGKGSGGNTEIGLFGYTLQDWEFTVCASGLESDLSAKGMLGNPGDSTDLSKIYGPITASINAQYYNYSNTSLYEVGWYVQPKYGDVSYSVYLMTANNKKFYLPGAQNVVANTAQGAVGYYADYYPIDYVYAVIEYPKGQILLQTKVVFNPNGANYG